MVDGAERCPYEDIFTKMVPLSAFLCYNGSKRLESEMEWMIGEDGRGLYRLYYVLLMNT